MDVTAPPGDGAGARVCARYAAVGDAARCSSRRPKPAMGCVSPSARNAVQIVDWFEHIQRVTNVLRPLATQVGIDPAFPMRTAPGTEEGAGLGMRTA